MWALGYRLALVLVDILVFVLFEIPLAMFIMVSDLPFLAMTLAVCCVMLALADAASTSTEPPEAPPWVTGERRGAT